VTIDWRGKTQEDCWDACFGPGLRDDQYKDEYREIMELITNIRLASATGAGTGTGASNGTAILLDTSIPSSTSDPKKILVLSLLRKLAQILSFAMPNTKSINPLFFIKFDGSRSWYCYEWACLGRCDAYAKLETDYGEFSSESGSKKSRDLADDSCKAAANVMDIEEENMDAGNHIACHDFTYNEMVIAIVNSPFTTPASNGCTDQNKEEQNAIHQLDGRGGYDEFLDPQAGFGDWCERKFTKRAIVGTAYADEDEMESFATVSSEKWPGSTYLREDEDLLAAADAIATCMNEQCCAGHVTAVGNENCVEFKDNSLNPFSTS